MSTASSGQMCCCPLPGHSSFPCFIFSTLATVTVQLLCRNAEVDLSLWEKVSLVLTFPIGVLRAIVTVVFLALWIAVASIFYQTKYSDWFIMTTGGMHVCVFPQTALRARGSHDG